ncbi:MAG: lysozyme [Cellvibrionaceae bacterium]|nr:lysozyme [Cellvibrionaceae bacterium]
MRHITQNGLNLIKQFEGFMGEVYICPAGYPTIGYGHVVKDDEDFSASISKAQAEALLRQDAATAERAVLRLIDVPLTDGQFDALVSFTYNLGSGALQRSTLRRKINREEHAEVPAQLMRWVWAGGRKLKGLMRRRQAEALCYIANISPVVATTPSATLPQ